MLRLVADHDTRLRRRNRPPGGAALRQLTLRAAAS
jgi:hypothetical protein